MDIKPVKKRRLKQTTQLKQPIRAVQPRGQKSITLHKKPVGHNSLTGYPSNGRLLKLKSFFKKNLLLILVFIFLTILYIPSARFIDTNAQHQQLLSQSSSIELIQHQVTFLPQKIFLYLNNTSVLSGTFMLKILSFFLTLLVVYLFYAACRRWLGKTTALITTFLFASSSWVILSSQSLKFDDIYLLFIPLVIYINYLLAGNKNYLKIVAATLAFSVTLYSPGMVWPILGIIVLLPMFMQKILAKYNLGSIWIFITLTFVSILPLFVVSLLHNANFSYLLTGHDKAEFAGIWQNLQTSVQALFVKGPVDSTDWLSGTPIIDYLVSVLFLFGLVYLCVDNKIRSRFYFLAVSIVSVFLVTAFVGLPALSLVVPVIYITAGFGLRFLLDRWQSLFPNNPVARNTGLSLVIFVVCLSAGYQVTRYYIAWPKANGLVSVSDTEKIT